jgi:hypothetical protein
MDKLRLAAIFAAGAVTGSVGIQAAGAAEPVPTVTLQNVQLIRVDEADGGVTWNGRACAHEQLGTLSAEPCWSIELTDSEAAVTVARALAQKR